MGENNRIDFTVLKDIPVLFVEDDPDVHERVLEFLQIYFNCIHHAFNGKDGLALFRKHDPGIVLTDIRMPVMDGLEMAGIIKKEKPETPVIIITAFTEIDYLMQAIELGVDNYVTKPTKGQKILAAMYTCLLPQIRQREIDQLNEEILAGLETRISRSAALKDVIRQVNRVARSDFSVIIHGETGVGKSYTARIIHDLSRRAAKSFVTVDIGAIPETLVESELFGRKKGAYTGAVDDKKGFFEIAHGGTLFLEDLENLNLFVQGKLLRAVEEKKIIPVGSTTPVDVDIRIICASNKELREEVKQGNFREDLFYRLCEYDIHLPPLRERKEDIPFLADKFITEVTGELDRTITGISPEALEALQNHYWHGNIREFKNVMRRAVLLCEGEQISGEGIRHLLAVGGNRIPINEPTALQPQSAAQAVSSQSTDAAPEIPFSGDYALQTTVQEAEKIAIRRALEKTGGKKVKAAALLKVDYKTLVSKMTRYDIR